VARYICPKCGNTGPGAFRFDARTGGIRCRRCGAEAEFESESAEDLENVTRVTWVVAWDLPGVVDPAARRRFYRWLRGAMENEPKVRRPLASLVEADDHGLARAIANKVKEVGGTVRLYRVHR